MSSGLVQGISGSVSAASLPLTFASANTAGNTLVANSPQLYNGSGGTVSDTLGNTWQQNATSGIWYALSCKAGSNKVTFALSGAGYIEGTIGEVAAASAVDQSAAGSGTTAAIATSSVTTTANGEVIVASMSGGPITPGTGYTQVAANPGSSLLEVQIQTSAGSIAGTGTISPAGQWYAGLLTFKAATTTLTASLSDTFTVTDRGLTKQPQRHVSETYSITDGLTKQPQKHVAETYTVAESFGKQAQRHVAEAYAVAESFLKQPGKALAESFSLTETLARGVSKAFGETYSVAESLSRSAAHSLADSLIVAEVLLRSTARNLTEAFSLAELFAASKTKVLQFAEAFNLSEALARLTGKSVADSITPAESISRATARQLGESFSVLDSLGKLLARGFSDTFSLLESFRTNAIGASDALRRFVAQILQRLWQAQPLSRTSTVSPVLRSWAATGDTMIYAEPKDSEAIEDFELDWSAAIAPDTIASSSWEVPEPLTIAAQDSSTTTATVRLAGGTAGAKYLIKNLVVLASGQTKAQSLLIPVV